MAHSIDIQDVVYTSDYFHNFWDVLKELQTDDIRVMRYRYRRLPWTSLAILPPSGYCLGALEPINYGLMQQVEWYRMQDSDEIHKTIYREFRDLGLLKKDIPIQWVGAYGAWGKFFRSGGDSELFIASLVMPSSIESAVIDLIYRMNTSMPDIGLFKLPPDFKNYPHLDEARRNPAQFPWRLMLDGYGFAIDKDPSARLELVNLTLQYLRTTVAAMEKGEALPYPPDLWVEHRCRFSFYRGQSFQDETNLGFEDKLDMCDAYRARLLRLLGRPHMWYLTPDTIFHCKVSFAKRPPATGLPYDVITELDAYQAEILDRYPWVAECPYSAVGVPYERPIYRRFGEEE